MDNILDAHSEKLRGETESLERLWRLHYPDVYDIEEYGLYESLEAFATWAIEAHRQSNRRVIDVRKGEEELVMLYQCVNDCVCPSDVFYRQWCEANGKEYGADAPAELVEIWEATERPEDFVCEAEEVTYSLVEIAMEVPIINIR